MIAAVAEPPAAAGGSIPVIDIAGFTGGTAAARRDIAASVAEACEQIGFLCIAGHDIDAGLLDRAFAVSREFFELPLADKLRYSPQGEVAPRGYAALASKGLAATLGEETPKDLREQFMLGTLAPMPAAFETYPHARGCYAPNIWPHEPAAYRAVFTQLYRAMETLAERLMHICALGLDLPEDYFDRYLDHHFSVLGSNYYPMPKEPPLPGQLRTGAHTDFGSLTILCPTAGLGGLQVRMADGTWQSVPLVPGTLIVNIGDMLGRWTNDRWKSTLHRVVNPPQAAGAASRRQSIAYFCHPNYDAEIACLASCTSPDNPPRYPRILAGEHMRQKMVKR
ncbi:MAG TPA: 2-oxoglutarate and iron-dependent oxygenase domain-containing protein [Stellaceae bacterium]|jgi:isopenicillin N synthase-like dioxygenase|nr:2-oxoglutarate and iron-dependent oxygenase domain-containing protein [Stellaceae bacterium]